MRAFAQCEMDAAIWHLVDHDPDLLAAAKVQGGPMVHTHVRDLTALGTLPLEGASLVTASALLDLCGAEWLKRLAELVTAQRLPFYAALSYDGVMTWSQADPADRAVTSAFNRHQHGDKGFGPALGPDAPAAMRQIFLDLGYHVLEADSPWQLGTDQPALQDEFLCGVAQAAAELGERHAQDWLIRRRALIPKVTCTVGHRDVLAVPPELMSRAQVRPLKEIANASS